MQKGVTDHVRRNLLTSAQHQRIVIPKISYVGDAPHQRLDEDRERPRPGRLEDFPQISRRDEYNLRHRIVQPLDFAVLNRLHLPPELPDFLFLIIVRKDLAETLERYDFRRQLIPPKHRLKPGRGPGHQAKPQIPRKRRSGIPQLVLAVKFAHRLHGWTLLLPQALPHLRPECRPVVGADVRFETRRQQRADRRKHRLAAVHTYSALRSGPRARSWCRRLRRRWRWCLHLH